MKINHRLKRGIKRLVPIHLINQVKKYLIFIPFEMSSRTQGKIKEEYNFSKRNTDKICIFSHFDKDNIIDSYVIEYIQKLYKQGFDIVFVSTTEVLSFKEVEKLTGICRDVLVKENIGYDFGAWQTGILYLDNELNTYDSLLLCNDSVYAPLFDLDEMFTYMDGKYNFWGITESYEIHHHIQSYFMVFDKKLIQSEVFQNIWRTYKVYQIKRNIILQYEIGMSRKLLKKGYSMGAYCSYEELKVDDIKNATHYYWKGLIEKLHCPIIKVELLRDNPQNIDIADWDIFLEDNTNYDIKLINKHLERVL